MLLVLSFVLSMIPLSIVASTTPASETETTPEEDGYTLVSGTKSPKLTKEDGIYTITFAQGNKGGKDR